MKKLLVSLLAVILVLVMATVSVCAATASPEVNGVVSGSEAKDSQGNEFDINLKKIDGKVIKEFADGLKTLKEESGEDNLKIVAQYDVLIEGTPVYPVTITLDVLGISASSKVYVLVQEGSAVKAIETVVMNGRISFTIDKTIQKIALVVDKQTATNVEKENNVLSPQTADSSLVVFIGIFAAALAGFAIKKVRA